MANASDSDDSMPRLLDEEELPDLYDESDEDIFDEDEYYDDYGNSDSDEGPCCHHHHDCCSEDEDDPYFDDVPGLVSESDDDEVNDHVKKQQKTNEQKDKVKTVPLAPHLNDLLEEELFRLEDKMTRLEIQVDPEKEAEAERLKQLANDNLHAEKYAIAVSLYSQAIELQPSSAILYGNRSCAHTKLFNYGLAIADATEAIARDASYLKGYFRRGVALFEMKQYEDAMNDFKIVLEEDRSNQPALNKYWECERKLKKKTFSRNINKLKTAQSTKALSSYVAPASWISPDKIPSLSMLVGRVIAAEINRNFDDYTDLIKSLPKPFTENIVPWLSWDTLERARRFLNSQEITIPISMKPLNKFHMIKQEEDFYRNLYAQKRTSPVLNDPYLHLVKVNGNENLFEIEDDPEISGIPKLFDSFQNRPIGKIAVVDHATFLENLNIFTEGQLAHLNWNNVLLAGGSVLAALLPTPSGSKFQYYNLDHAWKASDIDLFIYGLSRYDATRKLNEIYESILKSVQGQSITYLVVRTRNVITITSCFPRRHIQIVLRLYMSPAEILMGFDVDACSVGFDGVNVWATPRAIRALKYQTNFIDLSRRSPSYENRLEKYAKRGFSVSVPGLDMSRVLPGVATAVTYGYYQTLNTGLHRLLRMDAHHKSKNLGHDILGRFDESKRPSFRARATSSDYSSIVIPYGPRWNTADIERHLIAISITTDDWYWRLVVCNPPLMEGVRFVDWSRSMEQILHRLINIKEVERMVWDDEEDCNLAILKAIDAEQMWITENPGQQGLTGSFHPIQPEDAIKAWEKGVYEIPEEARRARKSSMAPPRHYH